MSEHDGSYKLLFSHRELVRDLLLAYVPGPWGEADFETLERVNASYVSESQRQRHDDMVWRVKVGQRWVWVYVLLEFQQESDPMMALRMMVYVGLLAQHLVRERQYNDDGSLPMLLPVVLYTGETPWKGAQEVGELFDASLPTLIPYVPRLRYVLLEQARLIKHEVPAVRNLAQAVFELQHTRHWSQFAQVVQALQVWLADEASREVRRHVSLWLQRLLQRSRLRGKIPALDDPELAATLLEPNMNLVKQIERWAQHEHETGRQEGRQEGLQEGLKEGLKEGELLGLMEAVRAQAQAKFGELPSWAEDWLKAANREQLVGCLLRMLQAQSVQELFPQDN